MKVWKTVDAHCPTCRGLGSFSEGRFVNGEWWESFHDCYCVEIHHDAEAKAFLKRFSETRDHGISG